VPAALPPPGSVDRSESGPDLYESAGLRGGVDRERRVYLGVGVAILVALSAVGVAGWYLPPGCQPLSTATSPEPMGWEKVSDPAWTAHGAPVLFFAGSIACPYCDAST
jgi:hypothetical protein